MTDEQDLSRPWRLIQFKPQGRPSKMKSIELVPTSWITLNNINKKCRVIYPGPPYTEEKKQKIRSMVKNLINPEDDWPTYAVELKGSAGEFY